MERKFFTFKCGLAQIWSKKATHGEKEKIYFFEAFFKLKIHKIKTLQMGKSSPPELSFSVKLGNCLFLLWP